MVFFFFFFIIFDGKILIFAKSDNMGKRLDGVVLARNVREDKRFGLIVFCCRWTKNDQWTRVHHFLLWVF